MPRFAALFAISTLLASAQTRAVAITVDDLPYAPALTAEAQAANSKLLAAFRSHHVPVTGFVIGSRADASILKEWVDQGFELGNHSYSHADGNGLTVAEIEEDIVRGEEPLKKKPEFFRFPMNHTGDTKEKHDALAAFLAARGYQLATCTIDTEDYLFNEAYLKMLAKNDEASARKLREEYLRYTDVEIGYYASLHRQVFGYEPPQVMLLHDNRLNGDVMNDILAIFEKKQFRFVSLKEAQSDPAYRTPETFITKSGMMWGYRWAKVRGVKVDGSLETEPPDWVLKWK